MDALEFFNSLSPVEKKFYANMQNRINSLSEEDAVLFKSMINFDQEQNPSIYKDEEDLLPRNPQTGVSLAVENYISSTNNDRITLGGKEL